MKTITKWKLEQKKISRLKCEQKDKKSREHNRYVGYSKRLKYKYLESQQEKKKRAKPIFEKVMIKRITKQIRTLSHRFWNIMKPRDEKQKIPHPHN